MARNYSSDPINSTALNGSLYVFNSGSMDWDFSDMGYTVHDLELSWTAQLILIVLYTTTILMSVIGNMVVIIVLLSAKRQRSDINIFLVNLAVADLCMACFCIPFTFTRTMLGRWIFGRVMCPVALFMQVFSVGVSIFTNTAIGLDRFWGIVFPMRLRLTRSKARLITGMIWLCAFSLACPQLFVSRSNQQHYLGIRYWDCNERWPTPKDRHIYTVVISCLTYIVPLLILAGVYSKIGSILWMRKVPGNADSARDKLLLRSKQKVVKMVFTLVVVFALCWFPLHTFTLILDFAPQILDYIQTNKEQYIFVAVFYTCHWLAMANSFTNPIIFCFLNESFRADMQTVLLCKIKHGRFRFSTRSTFASRLSLRFSRTGRSSVSSRKVSINDDKHEAKHWRDNDAPSGDEFIIIPSNNKENFECVEPVHLAGRTDSENNVY